MNGGVLLLGWATLGASFIAWALHSPSTKTLIAKLNQTRKDNSHA